MCKYLATYILLGIQTRLLYLMHKSKETSQFCSSLMVCARRMILLLFSVFLHVMFVNFEITCFRLGPLEFIMVLLFLQENIFSPFLAQVSFKCTAVRKL